MENILFTDIAVYCKTNRQMWAVIEWFIGQGGYTDFASSFDGKIHPDYNPPVHYVTLNTSEAICCINEFMVGVYSKLVLRYEDWWCRITCTDYEEKNEDGEPIGGYYYTGKSKLIVNKK